MLLTSNQARRMTAARTCEQARELGHPQPENLPASFEYSNDSVRAVYFCFSFFLDAELRFLALLPLALILLSASVTHGGSP